MNLTDLERNVLEACIENAGEVTGGDYTFGIMEEVSAEISEMGVVGRRQFPGVVSSLVKKGLITIHYCSDYENPHTQFTLEKPIAELKAMVGMED